MKFLSKNGKGLLLCLGLAIPSCILGKMFPVIGGPVFAILIGMVLALVVKKKEPFEGGVKFTSKKILQCIIGIWNEFRSGYGNRKAISSYYNMYDYHFVGNRFCTSSGNAHS